MSQSERSLEEVDKVVRLAKLDPSELMPCSQALAFSGRLLDQSRVLLVEVDAAQADALEAGDHMVMRGKEEDGVVMCTSEGRTFDVKEAETSNSLVVVESLSLPDDPRTAEGERRVERREVRGVYRKYLELKPCKPRLKRLREVLAERPLSSRTDLKDEKEQHGVDLALLLDSIQASEKELMEALKGLDACYLQGRYYLMDVAYRMKVVSDILKFVDENSWPLDRVDKGQTIDTLQELEPPELVAQVFDQYFSPNEEDSHQQHHHHRLDRRKLSRFYGEYLLHTGSLFHLEEFVTMWRQSLPEGVEPSPGEDLSGLAIVDCSKSPGTIRYFPEHSLPENVLERFQTLFSVKQKWTLEEIGPFVENLTTDKLDVKALLTKYARASNEGGVKVFSSKHGK